MEPLLDGCDTGTEQGAARGQGAEHSLLPGLWHSCTTTQEKSILHPVVCKGTLGLLTAVKNPSQKEKKKTKKLFTPAADFPHFYVN